MKSEIKKSLLEATPDLQESKSRVRKAVLQLPKKQHSRKPLLVSGCLILLLIILIFVERQSDEYVQGYSETTLNMYGLDDADHSERYRNDLLLLKYGKRKGVKLSKQDVTKLVASYEAELPSSFDKILQRKGITKEAYKEQYLTLIAQVQLVREALLPHYKQMYPQFHQEVHAQLLLLDAVEEEHMEDMNWGAVVDIHAIVLYEGKNARILALMDKKRLIEEQLIIMPIRDELTLKTGDEVLLENSYMPGFVTKTGFKYFAVSQNITEITTNKSTTIPAIQKKLSTLFEQMTWQNISQTKEPDMQLITMNGNYSVWYGDDIVIGSGDKGFIISKEQVQEWGDELIRKLQYK